ncbi:Uma2 family endonuclease [Luteolibacter arcticus]|uniref:Uma2 family endonuclease n=1 Tax=Luteolibacter arcticus TaxID=1581411 RepID=A0ABT3GCG5_9BACT|nr:Uma2 family endonuclease [Luteolibacter arcticus]MCW1920990.1 Uma2 family endonuclease [Luteolibacter arcticus]
MSLTPDLLERPTLALEVKEIAAFLAEEGKAREAFRDKIQPHEKGEFINGETVMHSPARDAYNTTVALIQQSIRVAIQAGKIGGHVVFEKALCAFTRNDYEPDVAWFSPEKAKLIRPDTTIYPVPDFIAEILSPATRKRDRGVKFDDYAAHGVAEYWIVDADERTVEQYVIGPDGVYQLAEKRAHGDMRPQSFPGLNVPLAALFDSAANFAFLKTPSLTAAP